MKSLVLTISLITLSFLSSITSAETLNPLNKAEAEVFLRARFGSPQFVSAFENLVKDTEAKTGRIKRDLLNNPGSPLVQRKAGDYYHVLGHIAEIRNDFSLAEEYHLKALKHFRASGGVTAETAWNDGVSHAGEHIFMSRYDQGILHENEGNYEAAVKSFRSALSIAADEGLGETYDVGQDERFLTRLNALKKRPDYGHITSSGISRLISKFKSCFSLAK